MNIEQMAYKKTLEKFEIKSQSKIKIHNERKNMLYITCPKLRVVDEEIVSTMVNFSKSFISENSNNKIEDAKEKIKQLKAKRHELTALCGLPEDYLDLKYDCKKCSDFGFVGSKMCECFENEYRKEVENLQKYALKEQKSSFNKFDLKYYENENDRLQMKTVKDIAIKFCKNFESQNKGMLFIGDTGLGKTFLAGCIANAMIAKGKSVVFDLCQNIIDNMEKERFNKDVNVGYTENIYECDLLIIDDLGAEFKTQFSQSMIYNIFNLRERNGKKIIVTTNLSDDEIEKEYGKRVHSRLFGNLNTLGFVGTDIRGRVNG